MLVFSLTFILISTRIGAQTQSPTASTPTGGPPSSFGGDDSIKTPPLPSPPPPPHPPLPQPPHPPLPQPPLPPPPQHPGDIQGKHTNNQQEDKEVSYILSLVLPLTLVLVLLLLAALGIYYMLKRAKYGALCCFNANLNYRLQVDDSPSPKLRGRIRFEEGNDDDLSSPLSGTPPPDYTPSTIDPPVYQDALQDVILSSRRESGNQQNSLNEEDSGRSLVVMGPGVGLKDEIYSNGNGESLSLPLYTVEQESST